MKLLNLLTKKFGNCLDYKSLENDKDYGVLFAIVFC